MRSAITNSALTAVLAMAATFVASCAQVEADVPEAQVTQKGVAFHGTGWSGSHDDVSATQTFTLSSENLSWVKDLNSKVYLTEIELRATGGTQDLSFIHYAHVTISDGDHKGMAIDVVDYAAPEHQAATPVLTAKTPYPIDISKVWTADRVVVTVSVAGQLPDKAWSVDVTLHLSGKISYKL
jgi:hypothetical protein